MIVFRVISGTPTIQVLGGVLRLVNVGSITIVRN